MTQRGLTSGRQTIIGPLSRGGRASLAAGLVLLAALLALAAGTDTDIPGGGSPESGLDPGRPPKPPAIGLAAPAAAHRSQHHASLEPGNLSEFDQASAVNASLGVSKQDPLLGAWCAEATYWGDGANGYARGIFHLSWRAGDRVAYSAGFRLPAGFYDSQEGQVDLIRWDNWPLHGGKADFGGVVIYGSDKRARLVRGRYNGEEVPLGSSFALPEGRWFTLSIFERLSRRHPVSRVRLDGTLVASSRVRNFYGRPINRIRYGIVAIGAGQQSDDLHLWFDEAVASRWR